MLSLAALCTGGLLGTAAQMQLAELPAPGMSWLALAGAALLAFAGTMASRWRAAGQAAWGAWASASWLLLWWLAAAIGAFAVVSLRAEARLAERLPAALEGRDIVVTGLVAQLPRSGLQGTRFLFEVEAATLEGRGVALPPLLSLGWFRGAEPDALLLGPQVEVRAGQRWRFTVRLRQPHGPFNPGGFDLELWLFERGIGATGQVRARAGDAATLLAEAAGAPIERARQHVRDAIERRVAGSDVAGAGTGTGTAGRAAGVMAALAVGDQAAIERDEWELFRLTGVAHLMSISGLHVTMFAWLAGGLVGWLWRRSARAMHGLPAPLAARWGGVAAALAYALFAGWGVPAQRTVCMLASVAALQSLGVRWPLPVVLLVAATVVVAADPWALLQPGFWLSFVAVGLLAASQAVGEPPPPRDAAAGLPPLRRAVSAARSVVGSVAGSALRTQAVATIGLAPLSLVFFQQVSLVGFAANLVAIPLVTLLVTPLALLGVLLAPLWDVAALVLSALMPILQWLAGTPGAGPVPAPWPTVWQAAAAPPWAVAAGLLGGLVAVLPLPWPLRVLALPLMLPLVAPAVPRPAEGRFELVALDVGQGTAAFVRTRHHLLVYDTGPAPSPESDAGSRLVVPLLRRRGEPHIDLLMLSHRDADHVGGAAAVLAALPVRALSSSLEEVHPLLAQARAAGADVRRCAAGQQWLWDGVRFEVLHPGAADHELPGVKSNALSCVLRVTAADGASALLTGDIEAAQEAELRERDASRVRAQLLLVPHHGSRTSSTPGFIDAVAPAFALVQASYRSRFGHPAADVVARYEARGITLARSDRCGALTLAPGGALRCERETARRYWHHRAG
ncbi:MAG: DNA internalization-related competence protein ComEC/Rec2 [Burkholderiales bacterium]|nr:DNA internalization-related competence protein ComEC/Rec2 [Burkholderiales bacterium]